MDLFTLDNFLPSSTLRIAPRRARENEVKINPSGCDPRGKGEALMELQDSTHSTEQQSSSLTADGEKCHGMALDANNKLIRCPERTPLNPSTGKPRKFHSDDCLNWTHARVKCGWQLGDIYLKHQVPSKKTILAKLKLSAPPTLEELRLDYAWEARRGIGEFIACRHCGMFRKTPLWQRHLAEHKLTVAAYKALYPGVRLISFAYIADRNAATGRGSTDVKELMAKCADAYFGPKEILEGRADPKWEERKGFDLKMCRSCGRKVGRLAPHLAQVHKQTTDEYLIQWPNAPLMSDTERAAAQEYARESRLNVQAKLAEAERLRAAALPDDWDKKTPEEIFIGMILIQRKDSMSQEELADRLDASGLKCRFSGDGSWGVITRAGSAANAISKVRKWVGRQGKTPKK
jgi:predicted transcriptional regulator